MVSISLSILVVIFDKPEASFTSVFCIMNSHNVD